MMFVDLFKTRFPETGDLVINHTHFSYEGTITNN